MTAAIHEQLQERHRLTRLVLSEVDLTDAAAPMISRHALPCLRLYAWCYVHAALCLLLHDGDAAAPSISRHACTMLLYAMANTETLTH